MVDELIQSLLYEGYALYPYTSGATKNATPTPFGIVYPAAYAADNPATFARSRLQCLAEPVAGATLSATLYFLTPSGARHEALERRVELGPVALGERASTSFAEGRFTLRSDAPDEDGLVRVSCCVHNLLEAPVGLDRARALERSLISTHILVRISAGRFISPLLSSRCESVNIWPVLASEPDDAVLGAAIVLPDHPQLAPESRGNLFDNTEIEEALLLHVQVLSDGEREQIADQDPAVRAMLERAMQATPQDILALHGGMRPSAAAAVREGSEPRSWATDGGITTEPPTPSLSLPDPSRGEQAAEVDGVTFRLGGKVVLRPPPDADLHDRMLEGRVATIGRIYFDYDDKLYVGVTVDGDPGQELMGETGRYLFFFANELEVMSS